MAASTSTAGKRSVGAQQSQSMPRSTSVSGKRGINVLRDPQLNKSTAFTKEERNALGLTGLLPAGVDNEENQVLRVLRQLGQKTTDLERYIYLIALSDTDETLFYKVLMADPARFLPIVYDPTVAEACLKFGHIFRRPRGMYINLEHWGRVKEVLRNWPGKEVRVICVSSGGRILGLGDFGANGMGIPIGKLQLYTACAAVPPQYLLPIHFNVGTNNQALLADPLYLGLRQPRVETAVLDEFFEQFVEAVQEVFPVCCIHFEDWAGVDAMRLLARYRDRICCYNDDIQGTAGVVLAGLLGALRVTRGKLRDQRILFLGAGSAGIGIANLVAAAMGPEGLPLNEAQAQISLFDVNGLLEPTRKDLFDFQVPYAQPARANPGLRGRYRVVQANGDYRRQHGGQNLHPAGGRSNVADQRPAHHFRPLESHRSRGMHPRRSLSMVQGESTLRIRRAVPAGQLGRRDAAARAGQQPLHFPRSGHGHLRHPDQARDR